MAVKQLRKAFLAMTPQLIPVSEKYEALVAGARKTAGIRACMVFKTSSTLENFPAVTAYILGEVHHTVCGVASCGGPGSFSAHMIFRILGRDIARQAQIFAE